MSNLIDIHHFFYLIENVSEITPDLFDKYFYTNKNIQNNFAINNFAINSNNDIKLNIKNENELYQKPHQNFIINLNKDFDCLFELIYFAKNDGQKFGKNKMVKNEQILKIVDELVKQKNANKICKGKITKKYFSMLCSELAVCPPKIKLMNILLLFSVYYLQNIYFYCLNSNVVYCFEIADEFATNATNAINISSSIESENKFVIIGKKDMEEKLAKCYCVYSIENPLLGITTYKKQDFEELCNKFGKNWNGKLNEKKQIYEEIRNIVYRIEI